jgi:hypothetical protein
MMAARSIRAAMAAALFFVEAGAAHAQNAVTQIDFSINYLFNSLRPDPRDNIPVTHTYSITLSGAGRVDEKRQAQSGAASYASQLTRVLGESSSEGKTGGAWRVAGPNKLVRQRNLPQSAETLTVSVKGQSCDVTVDNRLKPGFSEFEYSSIRTGEWQYFSRPQVTSASCAIR